MVQVFNKSVSVELKPGEGQAAGEISVDANAIITSIRVRGLNNDPASPIEVVVEVKTASGAVLVTPYLVMPGQVIDASITPAYDLLPHGDVIEAVRLSTRYTSKASEASKLILTAAGYALRG